MSRAYVGIDPGITGAIAVISTFGPVTVMDVPTYAKEGGGREYNFYEMWKQINRTLYSHAHTSLTLEQQQAMPKQGVSSTFATGRGYGAWQALCTIVTPDYQIVSPRKWKKKLGLTSDKEESRELAIKLFPNLKSMLIRKKDHNRAEALLLAHYTKLERS